MDQNQTKRKKFFEEEVTFREMLLKIREYIHYWLRHWKWVLFSALIVMLLMGGKALFSPTEYNARLSFMINQDNGNPLGSIGGVLGTFGISTRGKNNLSKVLELARSRKIIKKSLFRKVTINGQEELIVNHLITYLDTIGQWNHFPWYASNKNRTDTFPDHFSADKTDLDDSELKALKKLIRTIGGDPESGATGMLQTNYDEASRILYLSIKSLNPELSVQISNVLFDELSAYYIESSIEKQQATYDIVKTKSDSIAALLEQKEQQLAALEDTWLGRYSSQSKLQERRLEKEIRLLNITLAESIKNKEIADFAVRNTTPYVQVIDRPEEPLDGQKDSWIKNAIWGLIIGGLIALSLLFLNKLFRDALKH
jgi:uncharacterized protein YukE